MVAAWRKQAIVEGLKTGLTDLDSTTQIGAEEATVVASLRHTIAASRRHTMLPLDDCLNALQPYEAPGAEPKSSAARHVPSAVLRWRQANAPARRKLLDRVRPHRYLKNSGSLRHVPPVRRHCPHKQVSGHFGGPKVTK